MKNPDFINNKIGNSKSIVKKEVTVANSINFGTTMFYPESLDEEKEWSKFIKFSESIVRRSMELKSYIKYLKEECDLGKCHFYKNMNADVISLEMHHYPFSMFDITELVARRLINEGKEISSFLVAHEVCLLHFEGKIGLVPLSKTVHQLAHSGKISIPINSVYGNIKAFISDFKREISKDHLKQLEMNLKATETEIRETNKILEEDIVYNVNNQIDFFEEVLKMIPETTEEEE